MTRSGLRNRRNHRSTRIVYKFRDVVKSCIPERRMSRLLELVQKLGQLDDTREPVELVAAKTH